MSHNLTLTQRVKWRIAPNHAVPEYTSFWRGFNSSISHSSRTSNYTEVNYYFESTFTMPRHRAPQPEINGTAIPGWTAPTPE